MLSILVAYTLRPHKAYITFWISFNHFCVWHTLAPGHLGGGHQWLAATLASFSFAMGGMTLALALLACKEWSWQPRRKGQCRGDWGSVPPNDFIWILACKFCVISCSISMVWVPMAYMVDTVLIIWHSVTKLPSFFTLGIRNPPLLHGNTGVARSDPFHTSWDLKDGLFYIR